MIGKKNFVTKINDRFAKLAEWVLDHRLLVIITSFAMIIFAVVLTRNVRLDTTTEAFFNEDDPTFVYYHNFLKEYGNDEFLYIVYHTEQGIFNLDTLQKTRTIVKDIEGVPYVKRVNAVTNLEFIEGRKSDEIKVYDLEEVFPSTQNTANELMQKILGKPLYVNSYISANGKYAAILCEMEDKPKDDSTYHRKITSGLKSVLSKDEYKDFEFWPVGMPIFFNAYNDLLESDSINVTLAVSIIFIVLLYLFFQNILLISSIGIGLISAIFVLGFMSIFDFPITAMFSCVGGCLTSIGLASAVHIINEYRSNLKNGYDNRTSIIESVRLVGLPCLFTSLTTAAGFASISISSMRGIREFGIYFSFGITIVFIISVSLLLVVLSFAGKKEKKPASAFQQYGMKMNKLIYRVIGLMLLRIAHINKKYYGRILVIAIIFFIVCIYGVSEMIINTSYPNQIGRTKEARDIQFVDVTMAGSGNFEILLDAKKADGVKSLKFVQTLEKIQDFANDQDYIVNKTSSVVDIVKDVNMSLHNNKKTFYRLPSSNEEVSQYILLYEISGGKELENLVSADISEARMAIFVKSMDSITCRRFYEELVIYTDTVIPKDYSYKITGASFLNIESTRYISEDMVKSIVLALVIISVMMLIILRSIKIGLLSMLPNLVPLIFFYALYGFFDIWLDIGSSIMGCIVVGIAVDDTIHFISRYHLEFNKLGNYKKALDVSMNEAGRAITITTILLSIGFFSMIIGEMLYTRNLGPIVSASFIIALIADYFIAPSLILLFKPFGKEFIPTDKTSIATLDKEHDLTAGKV